MIQTIAQSINIIAHNVLITTNVNNSVAAVLVQQDHKVQEDALDRKAQQDHKVKEDAWDHKAQQDHKVQGDA